MLFARELGLAEATVPWHANRVRVAELGAALRIAARGAREDRARPAAPRPDRGRRGQGGWGGRRVVGDAAQAQPRRLDVDEGRRRARPRPCLGARSARSTASTSAARAAWQAEWEALSGALATTGGAAAALAGALAGLEVDEARMRENLALTGGLVAAERLALVLTERVGRTAARELVRDASLRAASSGRPLAEGARGCRHGADLRGDRGRARPDDLPRLGRRPRRPRPRPLRGRAQPAGRRMTLHHVLDGPADAPPLLMASSLGTTHAMWEPQVSALGGALQARQVRPARPRALALPWRGRRRSTTSAGT